MKKITFLPLFLCLYLSGLAQYKNDNVLFKTVFPQELCQQLDANPGYLLLDVRSKGEYEDTSSSAGYNLGRLRGASNINVRELGPRLGELSTYKDKPIFVYCSHSQRSRRASKMLADSGFKKVFNVNGGVTGLRQFYKDDCLQQLIITQVGYKVIPPAALCDRIKKNTGNLLILDVRSDSSYNHITGDAKVDAYGRFARSIHIPLNDLPVSPRSRLPKEKDIVVVDMYGDEASKAAAWLKEQGYPNVSVLLEGIDRYLLTDKTLLKCDPGTYISPASFSTITSPELNRLLQSSKELIFVDVRDSAEYEGRHKETWRNIGRIRGAVHFPLAQLEAGVPLPSAADLSSTLVVYAFGSSMEAFGAAKKLSAKGYTDVRVLMGGLFNLRWTAANVKGNADLVKWVEAIPQENL